MGWFLVVLLFIVTLLLWLMFGLSEYARAVWAIHALEGTTRDKAKQDFWGPDDNFIYSGILAHVPSREDGLVWVWGKRGLKYFREDEYSVYSFFSACNPEKQATLRANGKVQIWREIDTSVVQWGKKAQVGNFVVITVAGEQNGGNLGRLREARAYDWWVFMPSKMGEQCGKL